MLRARHTRGACLAAVLHQLKLAIRRHEADHLLRVEAAQIYALVERDILARNSILSMPPLA